MIANRSVPTSTLLAHIRYADIATAIDWLTRTFGFKEHYRYGDPISGAQVRFGNAWMMLKKAAAGKANPQQVGYGTQSLTIFVDGVDGHYARTKAAGATIVEELHETIYGERQYGVEDFEGHHWLFSQHAQDLAPEEWGATVKESESYFETQPHPRFCYMEIPATDVRDSARFYAQVFGWNIRNAESARPSFDDAPGNISGAWVAGRPIAQEPGLLPYIWVDDIDSTLAVVAEQGGAILKRPAADTPGGTSYIATFRDPAGNILGLYQEHVQH
jgi:predicted enzyme related to lactoylglutathione lyase/uncharacterized glyoxalase superfamily protein PhnB